MVAKAAAAALVIHRPGVVHKVVQNAVAVCEIAVLVKIAALPAQKAPGKRKHKHHSQRPHRHASRLFCSCRRRLFSAGAQAKHPRRQQRCGRNAPIQFQPAQQKHRHRHGGIQHRRKAKLRVTQPHLFFRQKSNRTHCSSSTPRRRGRRIPQSSPAALPGRPGCSRAPGPAHRAKRRVLRCFCTPHYYSGAAIEKASRAPAFLAFPLCFSNRQAR